MSSTKKAQKIDSRQRNVALIIESSNEYARKVIHGISKYARENRQWSIFFHEHERGNPDLTWLVNWNGDGILARIENPKIADYVKNKELPTVDLSSFRLLPHIPYVETNDKKYAEVAAKHLLSRNFRNFAFCGDSQYNWSKLREKHFVRYIKEQGYPCFVFDSSAHNAFSFEARLEMIKWVKSLPKPIGIMACFDSQGQELLESCRVSNISVPYTVAVVGCDNDELVCELAEPSMSSVIPNAVKTGYHAALLLEKLMNGEELEGLEYLFDPLGVQTRQSTDVLATNDKVVVEALDYINKNACNGIKVQDVLEHIYLSRRVFENRFLKSVGKTPHEVIQDVKIKYAKQLLEETDLTVEEIAAKTGFFYAEYFCVAFKRHTSMVPSEYRKLNNTNISMNRQHKNPYAHVD